MPQQFTLFEISSLTFTSFTEREIHRFFVCALDEKQKQFMKIINRRQFRRRSQHWDVDSCATNRLLLHRHLAKKLYANEGPQLI